MDTDIRIETDSNVYTPAEDSFLLLKHAVKLKGKILEVGCGTGIVSLYCARANPKNRVDGVDINPAAISISIKNTELNKVGNAAFYESDLFSNVKGKYDWIVFNPPYLPTDRKEKIRGNLNKAFDGGCLGSEVLEKFIDEVPEHLEKDGGILIIVSTAGGKDNILAKLKKSGFKAKIIDEEALFFERLYVISAFFNSFQTR